MGTDRKRCVITPFHKNRRLGFPKRHRSKRMPIFREADKADLYIKLRLIIQQTPFVYQEK